MDNTPGTEQQAKAMWQGIVDTALKVIKTPAEFYRGMAKSGGFVDPLIFTVVMGVIGGCVYAVLGIVHLLPMVTTGMALTMIITAPIGAVIGSFIGGAIIFVIWKLMGSNESFETAYRCGAYAMAVAPITMLCNVVPYVGGLVGLAWMVFLLVTASVEVHKIAAKTAWLVFGIIGGVFALASINGQIKLHRMQRDMGDIQKVFGNRSAREMTPEDAAKAASIMMKAMQEEAAKEAAKAKADAQSE